MKEYVYNPTTVYVDPSTESTVGEYDLHRVQAVKFPMFLDNGSPFDPSVQPDPSPGPGPGPDPSPGPGPSPEHYDPILDPSSSLYDGDGNGVPDLIDTLQADQEELQQQTETLQKNNMWNII